MSIIVKICLLVLLALVANAAPVQDNLVTAVVDYTDGLHGRESRSSDSTGEPGIPWHLDRIDQRETTFDGKYNAFANGTGVDIYMLVEGIDLENEEFGGRAFDGGFMPINPCSEFGSQLASVAAGRYAGVAKNANIYSINLMDCQLSARVSTMVEAVKHVIRMDKTTGRRSVLAVPMIGRKTQPLNDAVEEATKENIIVVTSAGDSLDDACEYSPGSSPLVINVGATRHDGGEDKLYETSHTGTNYGKCISLYAPGQFVTSYTGTMSGTAQSCSIVAGAAALVLERHPDYTPAEVKQYLIDNATDGVINMDALSLLQGDKGTNKLLYIGNGSNASSTATVTTADSSSSVIVIVVLVVVLFIISTVVVVGICVVWKRKKSEQLIKQEAVYYSTINETTIKTSGTNKPEPIYSEIKVKQNSKELQDMDIFHFAKQADEVSIRDTPVDFMLSEEKFNIQDNYLACSNSSEHQVKMQDDPAYSKSIPSECRVKMQNNPAYSNLFGHQVKMQNHPACSKFIPSECKMQNDPAYSESIPSECNVKVQNDPGCSSLSGHQVKIQNKPTYSESIQSECQVKMRNDPAYSSLSEHQVTMQSDPAYSIQYECQVKIQDDPAYSSLSEYQVKMRNDPAYSIPSKCQVRNQDDPETKSATETA